MTTPEKNPVILKKHEVHLHREQKQKKYLLAGLIVTLILVLGLIGYGLLDQFVLQNYRPVATVDNTQISVGYFQRIVWLQRYILYKNHQDLAEIYNSVKDNQYMAYMYGQQVQTYEKQLAASNTTQIGDTILNRMVEDILVNQEAKKRNITVTDEELNQYLQEKIFAYYVNGTPTAAPTTTPFSTSTLSPLQMTLVPPTETPTAALTTTPTATTPTAAPTATLDPKVTPSATPTEIVYPTATAYTLDAYNKNISQFVSDGKKYGLNVEDIKAFLRGFILREKLTKVMTSDMKPEEEQVWARHILVKDEATAKQVKERLDKGEDFAKIAKELSEDTGSKESGGDLGWFGTGKMVAEFETAAFKLKVGETSNPVKSQYGYHIIQALGHEVRPISESDFETLKNNKFEKWITDAVAKAKVVKVDNYAQYIPTEPALTTDEIIFPDSSSQ
jgi:peptidyl-prolyl cis-trans isomerase D